VVIIQGVAVLVSGVSFVGGLVTGVALLRRAWARYTHRGLGVGGAFATPVIVTAAPARPPASSEGVL
jgi:hypothetical protein